MTKGRLEAFSDGVLAIIITIMVLELKAPHAAEFAALAPLWPVFLAYVLSFLYLAIYWNNHHHMLQVTQRINGRILWANMHLLFWLSLLPFCTAWAGETHFAPVPTALYGLDLLLAAIAYWILQRAIIGEHGPDSTLARAVGADWKGKTSPAFYLTAILVASFSPVIAALLYFSVAMIWLIPDRRIERLVATRSGRDD